MLWTADTSTGPDENDLLGPGHLNDTPNDVIQRFVVEFLIRHG